MKNKLYINEIFHSIDGEGRRAGELASFIRLCGCNLRCIYCDTTYAFDEGRSMDVEDIVAAVRYRNVTLTGGEPLLQPIHGLLQALSAQDVNIETNGSVDILPYMVYPHVWFTIDYKGPFSQMEEKMYAPNFRHLRSQDVLKFVVGSYQDLEVARILCEEVQPTCAIYVGAVFETLAPRDIVTYMERYSLTSWRLQLQMHKYIWPPDMRGV